LTTIWLSLSTQVTGVSRGIASHASRLNKDTAADGIKDLFQATDWAEKHEAQ